jgi:hypothetical protein
MPTFCGRLCDSDAEAIEAVRAACHRLLPNWHHQERFFEARSEITSGLSKLLRLIGHDVRQLNGRVPAAPVLPHRVRTQAAIRVAERAFTLTLKPAIAHAGPQDALQAVLPSAAPEPPAQPQRAARRVPRGSSRRHRYPRPPYGVNGQGVLL